jgi:hypothetical protein
LIQFTQDLRRLLEKATEYWVSDYQTTPVYIIAQASCETNPRYTTVKSWSTPNDDNPFSAPFLSYTGAVMDNIILNIERGHWQSTVPGTGECVQISGLGVGNQTQTFNPTAATDDAYITPDLAFISTTSTFLRMGVDGAGDANHTGVRFRNVTVANGAAVVSAFIRFVAAHNNPTTTCDLNIVGENNAAPAAFSTYADFIGRSQTSASVLWNNVSAWLAGAQYDTPDISPVIQEIVDLGGWASGNDLVVFVEDNGSDTGGFRQGASFDHTVYEEAELTIVTQTAQVGRTATCEKEVYVANKHNEAQLTHIYVDDGGVFGANLVASTAFNLFPAVAAINDAVYFGVDTTTADSGPFASLVFDIDTARTGTASWEYWNGAWVAFGANDIVDNTAPDGINGNAFELTGVNSVHWEQQSDWATTTVNAVTGYWVRCRVTAGAATATQQNRTVYSILWPYVDIDDGQVGGDIPALTEVQLEPKSKLTANNVTATGPDLYANKALMGLRSLSRGADFTPFINLQNEQNPDGITITMATSATEVTDATTATGLHTLYNPAGTNSMQEEIRVIFSRDAALQWYGTYRMFVRGKQDGGALDTLYVQVEHKVNTFVTLKWSPIRQFQSTTLDWQILDFGQWQLPGFSDINADEGVSGLELVINCQSTSGSPGDLIFYELILWPIDEWAVEALDVSLDGVQGWVGGDRGNQNVWRYLSVDSLGYPRRVLRAQNKVTDLDTRTVWRPVSNGPSILQANADQRLWFLTLRNDDTGSLNENQYISEPYVGSTILCNKSQRYLSMRGAR